MKKKLIGAFLFFELLFVYAIHPALVKVPTVPEPIPPKPPAEKIVADTSNSLAVWTNSAYSCFVVPPFTTTASTSTDNYVIGEANTIANEDCVSTDVHGNLVDSGHTCAGWNEIK